MSDTRDDHVAYLENEVHRLTRLVALYAEETQRLKNSNRSPRTIRNRMPMITDEEARFALSMAQAIPSRRRA
jgi:cell shape-determining protein MreC